MTTALEKHDDKHKYYTDQFTINGKRVDVRKNSNSKQVEAWIDGMWKPIIKEDIDKQYRIQFDYSPYELEFSYNGGKTWWTYTDEKYMTDSERAYFKKEIAFFENWELEQWIAEEERKANDPEYQEWIAQQYIDWLAHEDEYYRSQSNSMLTSYVDIPDVFKRDDESAGENSPNSIEPNYMKYFEIHGTHKKFQPIWYGKDIIDRHMKCFFDGTFLYRYDQGVYVNDGERHLEQLSVTLLDNEFRHSRIKEARYYIEAQSYIAGTQINLLDDYINVKNGLLNWKTGELREHKPDRRSTIQFPVLYDPTANDPVMLQFIESVLEQDTHATLFEMIGYFLIPTLEYEKIFLFKGTGSNGKSVLIKTIEAMIGKPNISKVKIQDLEGDRSRFKIAELYGKVLNCFTDIPADALNSTGNLKVLASGEGLNAEKKGKDPFNFEPFCKLLFSANELPKSNDNSDGFFRRLTVFPFTRKFTDQQKDTKLIHKLTTPSALSTLLNYALEGLRRLEQQGGFSHSQTITDQVKTYQMESDTIMLFIDEECEIESEASKQHESRIECKRLYAMYAAWCKQGGFKPETVTQFNKHLDAKLKDKIYRKKARTISGSSVPFWFGIKS
ncbi:DNA primase family protein [Paenibacillus sp. FSL L8-0641]|uniref:DNA primase family protein n=1 Tax=Paenibacillus sp. FSL L8-0641 TaxID=2921605 RepID=UPI0030FBEF4C